MKLVAIVLAPLDLLIKSLVPDLTVAFSRINAFFDLLGDYASFGISYLGFDSTTISLIVIIFTSILTIPLAVHLIKLAVKWYNTLKFVCKARVMYLQRSKNNLQGLLFLWLSVNIFGRCTSEVLLKTFREV